MRRLTVLAASAFAIATFIVACEQEPTTPPDFTPSFSEDVVEGRYIVVLRDGVDPAALAASYGVETKFEYRAALSGFSAELPDNVRQGIEQNPLVRWVEPVKVRRIFAKGKPPDKPCKGKKCEPEPPPPPPGPACDQGTGQPGNDSLDDLWGMQRINVLDSPTWNGNPVNVDIAILDSGADLDHPDLCIQNAVSFDPFEPTPDDFNGHGTHTSGTAAARDDNGLVVGVAPTARIWVVKVCNSFGICFSDAIIGGINYVTDNADQIEVANMSLGGGGSDEPHETCGDISGDAEHFAICRSVEAGVTYAVAAGNSGADASGFVPAAYDEVITVAAMNDQDQAAGFSNFGPDVDLIAPGVGILSDLPGGGTGTASGTSMASPHVAGAAALYIAANPGLTPAEVQAALVANAQGWGGQGGNHPEPLLNVTGF